MLQPVPARDFGVSITGQPVCGCNALSLANNNAAALPCRGVGVDRCSRLAAVDQSRSSSLIEVLERVLASTFFTITAQ